MLFHYMNGTGADPVFQRGGGGTVKGSRGPSPGNFFIFKGFFMQSKAYWALFLTQYIA